MAIQKLKTFILHLYPSFRYLSRTFFSCVLVFQVKVVEHSAAVLNKINILPIKTTPVPMLHKLLLHHLQLPPPAQVQQVAADLPLLPGLQ